MTYVKWIKPNRIGFVIGEVISVHQITQSFVGMAHVHKHDMGTLLIITTDHVIGEERFTTTRRTKNEFIPVRTDSLLNWFI